VNLERAAGKPAVFFVSASVAAVGDIATNQRQSALSLIARLLRFFKNVVRHRTKIGLIRGKLLYFRT
jgi:hypothetical protein